MQNYKIIADEAQLKAFIEWLPELEKDEIYYVSLFARKKYDTTGTLKADKGQLKRFSSRKDRLFEKIKHLERPIGTYTHEGQAVSNESLALYITVNPRSLTKC